MAPKNSAPKSAPKVQAPVAGARQAIAFQDSMFGKTEDFSEIKVARRGMSAHYVPLVNRVLSLRVGQAFRVACPDGTDFERFRATVSTTLRKRTAGDLPKNTHLSFFKSEDDGKLVIALLQDK